MSMFGTSDGFEEFLLYYNKKNYDKLHNEKCSLERELHDMKKLVNKLK